MERDYPALVTTNTDNDLQMKGEAEDTTLHRMAKLQDLLEMWRDSQNVRATLKESYPENQ